MEEDTKTQEIKGMHEHTQINANYKAQEAPQTDKIHKIVAKVIQAAMITGKGGCLKELQLS